MQVSLLHSKNHSNKMHIPLYQDEDISVTWYDAGMRRTQQTQCKCCCNTRQISLYHTAHTAVTWWAYEGSVLLGCDITSLGTWYLTLWDNQMGSSSEAKFKKTLEGETSTLSPINVNWSPSDAGLHPSRKSSATLLWKHETCKTNIPLQHDANFHLWVP